MTTNETADSAAALPPDLEVAMGAFEGRSLGGDDGVSALERDIQRIFDESTVTYQNDWAANTVGGYTFADYDHDGWYDYLERTDYRGSFIYCGNDIWRSL